MRPFELEWCRLRTDPAALRRAATWRIVNAELESLDDILVAIGYLVPNTAETERNLRRLVAWARTDTLAAQVVMRRLLPGAVSIATRYRRRCDDALAEVASALWIAVRTFNLGRTPACLAAAVLADAEYRAFRRAARRRTCEIPRDTLDERAGAEHAPDPVAELADLVAAATQAGVADADDVALVRLLVSEPNTASVAARLNVTERTIRNRRARLTGKLRRAAA